MKTISINDLLDSFTPEFRRDLGQQAKLATEFSNLSKITDQWGFIREAYMRRIPVIMSTLKRRKTQWNDPYILPWEQLFSPIEMDAWIAIRARPMPLYPQFPVFNYFIDFANPYLRIGVELDGKAWHNAEKDRLRDTFLAAFGWKIFRIQGAECHRPFQNLTDIEQADELSYHDRHTVADHPEIRNWMLHTCDGVIEAIGQVFFGVQYPYYGDRLLPLAYRSLTQHRLADFDIEFPDVDDSCEQ